jgi:hypothetical protein
MAEGKFVVWVSLVDEFKGWLAKSATEKEKSLLDFYGSKRERASEFMAYSAGYFSGMAAETAEKTMEGTVDLMEALNKLESRVSALEEAARGSRGPFVWIGKRFRFSAKLPKSEIRSLQFNETVVEFSVMYDSDKRWHSDDVIFMSARNATDTNNEDALTEYLNCEDFKNAILTGMVGAGLVKESATIADIAVALPLKSEGEKFYNGVSSYYWMNDKNASKGDSFYCHDYISSYIARQADVIEGVAPTLWINEVVLK